MQKYQKTCRWTWVLGGFFLLTACGQKGDLYLPEGQASISGQAVYAVYG